MFLENIIEKENVLLRAIKSIQSDGLPIYIYGNGVGGHNTATFLDEYNIDYVGFVVDEKYYVENPNCYKIEHLIDQNKPFNLVIGCCGCDIDKLKSYKCVNNIFEFDSLSYITMCGEKYNIDYSWIKDHAPEIQQVYNLLEDEKSKEVLNAFLNQKISMKYGYLSKTKDDNQYFDDELIKLTDHETFIDCGAYNGDSAEAFLEALKRFNISDYDQIISFEPDETNYRQLVEKDLKNHKCLKLGVSDSKSVLYFAGGDTIGQMNKENGIKVEVDSIDNILNGKQATFIKMDIEGSELDALKGAKNTITNYKPRLAICIYHKKSDLYEIPFYIKSLRLDYKFYIRNYMNIGTELVLYAI